jgi:predicted transcriptional regulator
MEWKSIDIARWLGITRQRVQQILAAQGIYPSKTQAEKRANTPPKPRGKQGGAGRRTPKTRHILQAYKGGMSTAEIAKQAGVSQSNVANKVSRDLPPDERRNLRRSREEMRRVKARIYAYADDGFNGYQIAQMTSEHMTFVYRVLAERNTD